MKTYLVGGAVRDQLLGLPIKERDWVVVGSMPEQMIALGYKPVGKDFPVFLHPETKEEYALARIERKTAPGYAGFSFNTAPTVTLEEDLLRRDLTINAMAQSEECELIDPYGGQHDLQNKILRHVSGAFSEDPVRILRIGRFAARFPEFRVAPETNTLMQTMVSSGEVDALVAERVWRECAKALSEKNPERFIQVLDACIAFEKLFPAPLKSVDRLIRAATLSNKIEIRFAAWVSVIDGQELKKLAERYKIPNQCIELAELVLREAPSKQMDAEQLLAFFQHTDAFRRPERFRDFLIACEAIDKNNIDRIFLESVLSELQKIDIKKLIGDETSKEKIPGLIAEERLRVIRSLCS